MHNAHTWSRSELRLCTHNSPPQREDDAVLREAKAVVEWNDAQRWGVEHAHEVDLEDSDVEEAEPARAFEEPFARKHA